MKLNAGVIGVGNMGRHHARNFAEITSTNLVGVADVNAKTAKEVGSRYRCRSYDDYKVMLEKEKLDLVSIAVPTKFHKQVALDCILRGVNILIEKPIAATVEDAKEVVQKAKQRGIKFTVGHIERFNPAVQKLKSLIDQDKLGEIIAITAFRLGPTPNHIKDANVIVDIGVHDIDIMNWIFGKLPSRITARGGRALIKNTEDHVEVFLDYGAATGIILANWITPLKVRKLAVSGKKAYVELNYVTQELDFYESNVVTEYDDFGDFLIKFGENQKKKTITVQNIEPLKAEIIAFIKAIRNNTRPPVTAREAIDALDIAQKISKQIA